MSAESTVEFRANARPETVIQNINTFLKQPLTSEQTADVYNRWCDTYETDLTRASVGIRPPHELADAFAKLMPPTPQCRILDVACGTGLVAQRLRQLGYVHMDGIDSSSGMLEAARAKGLYENLFCELVGDQPLKCTQPRTYDALLTSGSFCPNHLMPSCARPLAALVKQGGLFGIAMRKQYQADMEPELRKLQSEGVWQVANQTEVENCYGSMSCLIYLFRVC